MLRVKVKSLAMFHTKNMKNICFVLSLIHFQALGSVLAQG